MERAMILFSLLFAMNAGAATPTAVGIVTNTNVTGNGTGLIPTECLSGTGACNIFTISAGDIANALTGDAYYPFYKDGSLGTFPVAPYRVTSGKTAYCFNFILTSGTQYGRAQVFSSSNGFAFAGTPTGVIYYQTGAASKYAWSNSLAANIPAPMPGTFRFSQNYYPGFQPSTSHAYMLSADCYEK